MKRKKGGSSVLAKESSEIDSKKQEMVEFTNESLSDSYNPLAHTLIEKLSQLQNALKAR